MATPIEVTELIQNSGNNFHAKVARWLAENGWHVVVSPYYMDQTQNKAREIDLVAEKLWPVNGRFGNTVNDIAVRLYIECKFVSSHSVFWFADKDRESALELVCASQPYRADNSYTKKHHYLSQSPRVAKLFSTSNRNARSNSNAPENEPFYKALNQSLNAMVSMRDKPVSIPSLKESQRHPKALIEFPVVVCSSFDKIYKVDFDSDSQPEPVRENFQLEVRYAYIDRHQKHKDDFFILDFIDFNKFREFSEVIEEDAKTAVFLVSQY